MRPVSSISWSGRPTASAPGAGRLGVHRLGFAIAGRTSGAGTGYVPAVEFAAVNPADFATAAARRAYENDWRNDSGAAFHYTVTNTAAAPGVFDAGGWNTQAKAGFAWNDKAEFAAGNAGAAFPDDVYDVTVTAADESGNVTTRTFPVLVDNWVQTVAPAQPTYAAGEPIGLTGDGYRAGQAVAVYLIPAAGGAAPAAGTPLSPEHFAGTVTADADGRLPAGAAVPGGPASGSYLIVTDYDGDGVYAGPFDGAAAVDVAESLTITAADDVLLAAYDPDAGGYFVPPPACSRTTSCPPACPSGRPALRRVAERADGGHQPGRVDHRLHPDRAVLRPAAGVRVPVLLRPAGRRPPGVFERRHRHPVPRRRLLARRRPVRLTPPGGTLSRGSGFSNAIRDRGASCRRPDREGGLSVSRRPDRQGGLSHPP